MMRKNYVQREDDDLSTVGIDDLSKDLESDLDILYRQSKLPRNLSWHITHALYQQSLEKKSWVAVPYQYKPVRTFSLSVGTAITLVLLFVTVATAATLAIPPLVDKALSFIQSPEATPKFPKLQKSDFTVINQSKVTAGGVEYRLEVAYADQLNVIVGLYASQAYVWNEPPKLFTKRGEELANKFYSAAYEENAIDIGHGFYYQPPDLIGDATELDLMLKILVDQEELTFDFRIPVDPSIILTPEQSAISHDDTLRLEQVIIAKSGIQIITHMNPPPLYSVEYIGKLEVIGVEVYPIVSVGTSSTLEDACVLSYYDDQIDTFFMCWEYPWNFTNNHGTWKFTIEEKEIILPHPFDQYPPPDENWEPRTWEFQFEVS